MKFTIYQDARKEWRWNLKAANNFIIAVSSESYINRTDCLNSIGLVMDTDRRTPIYE